MSSKVPVHMQHGLDIGGQELSEFFNPAFYMRALKSDNLWEMDTLLNRVFDNYQTACNKAKIIQTQMDVKIQDKALLTGQDLLSEQLESYRIGSAIRSAIEMKMLIDELVEYSIELINTPEKHAKVAIGEETKAYVINGCISVIILNSGYYDDIKSELPEAMIEITEALESLMDLKGKAVSEFSDIEALKSRFRPEEQQPLRNYITKYRTRLSQRAEYLIGG